MRFSGSEERKEAKDAALIQQISQKAFLTKIQAEGDGVEASSGAGAIAPPFFTYTRVLTFVHVGRGSVVSLLMGLQFTISFGLWFFLVFTALISSAFSRGFEEAA